MAAYGEPAVGEYYEAWPYGPVLSSLYHQFKKFGRGKIKGFATGVDPHTGKLGAQKISDNNTEFYKLFDKVWGRYKGLSGLQLSALTHADGTPWQQAREIGQPYLNNEDIRKHFIGIANANRSGVTSNVLG